LTEGKAVSKDTDSTEAAIKPQQETVSEGAGTKDDGLLAKPFKMRKRIGSTAYEVEVRFNPESRETFDDKILRLIRGEAGME
jgi:hypothetical protein